jgi:hypothetical protein
MDWVGVLPHLTRFHVFSGIARIALITPAGAQGAVSTVACSETAYASLCALCEAHVGAGSTGGLLSVRDRWISHISGFYDLRYVSRLIETCPTGCFNNPVQILQTDY